MQLCQLSEPASQLVDSRVRGAPWQIQFANRHSSKTSRGVICMFSHLSLDRIAGPYKVPYTFKPACVSLAETVADGRAGR